jgi:hypothetical protein
MKQSMLAAAFALAAPFGAWAVDFEFNSPDAYEPVPASGAQVNLPFSADLAYPFFFCGPTQYTWSRDYTDEKTCSGGACSATYAESAATRGPHVARADVLYWWTYPGAPSCIQGSSQISRTYVVQYPPTVGIGTFPWTLRAGQTGTFGAGGTYDAQYSKNKSLKYTWTFGDGGGATGATVTHAWSSCGDYWVRVTASDGALTATASRMISITSYNCTLERK